MIFLYTVIVLILNNNVLESWESLPKNSMEKGMHQL
jgi:hypothetical protein